MRASAPLCALLTMGWMGRSSAASATVALSRLAAGRAFRAHGARAPRAAVVADATAGGGRGSAAVVQDDAARAGGGGAAAQPALELTPPRGTRDFYPPEMRLRNWLFAKFKAASTSHGFEEYDAPVMEAEALYVRKAGEEVTGQLYNFEDKQGRRMSLRPEMTPSLARMVLAQRGSLPVPIKWFSLPQCWRYERTTRGRRREHYQWNMDVWGVESVEAEAELLSAATAFCASVGLSAADVGVRVSSRRVLSELLARLGVADSLFTRTCILIDKLDKIGEAEVRAALGELGLGAPVCDQLFAALALKSLPGLAKLLGNDSAAVTELSRLFSLAERYGYADWLELDLSVVRGLAYYTGVVFEGFDRKGELRAIFGGGRYDQLLTSFGAEPMAAVGFGFGDAVIVELLKDKALLPALEGGAAAPAVDAVVFALDPAAQPSAIAAASALRAAGRRVDLVLEGKKFKWVIKHAERLGAPALVVCGTKEAERGAVAVKTLATGEQVEVALAALADAVPRVAGVGGA